MSTSTITISSRRNNIQTAIAAFVGMALAIPVALLVVSMTQPASALKNESDNNNYALYAQAFSQGFMANTANANTGSTSGDAVSCEAPKDDTEQQDVGGMGAAAVMHESSVPMHNPDLVKHINNSYNEYTTHINNKDSNNTVQSVVAVSHSNGAVVSTGTSTSGGVENDVEVENKDSGNTVNVNSHNTTNTETNVDIEDSFNHEVNTTIDNSKTIKDSFNKEVELDVDVKIEDSGNTVLPKQHHS